MIRPGDRVLVCLSGGKDSLSLLHCMRAYQEACLRRPDFPSFDLGAVTVDPGSSAFDPRPLIPYLADLGVEYLYEEQSESYHPTHTHIHNLLDGRYYLVMPTY